MWYVSDYFRPLEMVVLLLYATFLLDQYLLDNSIVKLKMDASNTNTADFSVSL